ncbi:MATE family efflux transporter [Flavobacteriaceae bacterium]|nr:MATE family efflux transporter [Flavobacteriaceae bacterium]MDB4058707.1 MATE family efflux transporter [Flavobacteriaceae bacterium]MDC0119975.1 MATE family efflux transporter [Flavobacteriaceae bacterium]
MSATENPLKRIHRLAIPATIAGVAEPFLSLTDTAIVGNIPIQGAQALAAAGIVGSFLSMLVWVLGQTQSAISALVSQYLGKDNLDGIKALPMQAMYVNVSISILVLVTSLAFKTEIFKLMNASGPLLEMCTQYFSIRIWGFPLTLFTFGVFGVFRGLQNTLWPMLVALTGAFLNIGLDFILVYGIEGFIEPMFLEGAAWASLISQIVMAIFALSLLFLKTDFPLIVKGPIHPELKNIIGMSANLFVRSLALNTALILSVREATAMGTTYIGAHTILLNLWLFSAFFIEGYGTAGNSIGGKLLGAKNYTQLWELGKKVAFFGFVMGSILLVIGTIFYRNIGGLFSENEGTLLAFEGVFFILLICLPTNGVAFVLDGMFKGLGEMKFLRNVLLLASFGVFVPLVFWSNKMNWGLTGIWVAFGCWMVARGLALIWKFRRKFLPLKQNTYI